MLIFSCLIPCYYFVGSIADLPEPMAGACVVNFGGSFLFATGGFDYKTEPNCKDKTYFYDESENKWEKGKLKSNTAEAA